MPEGPAQQHDLPGVVEVVLGESDELREGRIRRNTGRAGRRGAWLETSRQPRAGRRLSAKSDSTSRCQASSVGSDGVGQSSSGDNCRPSPPMRRSTS